MEYLAYGSNMLTARFTHRVPSAHIPRVVELPGYEVRYRKVSKDGSAKCDPMQVEGATAFGVVFDIDAGDKPGLDRCEGAGRGYSEEQMTVTLEGRVLRPLVYLADVSHIVGGLQPYDWYRDQVVCGARQHGLPEGYVREQLEVDAIADPDSERAARERAFLGDCQATP